MKKTALARAAVAAAVAAHKSPGLAALKAAAEAAELLTSSSTSVSLSDNRGAGREELHVEGDNKDAEGVQQDAGKDAQGEHGCAQKPLPPVDGLAPGSVRAGKNEGPVSGRVKETNQESRAPRGDEEERASLLSVLYPSRDAAYPPDLALFLVKQLSTAKFTETVELHVQLNLGTGTRGKVRKGANVSGRVRGFVTLPHGELGQLASPSRELEEERDAKPAEAGGAGEKEAHTDSKTGENEGGDEEASKHERGGQEDTNQSRAAEAAEGSRTSRGEVFEETPRKNGGLLAGVVNEKPESGIVRGNKRGGIWRRKRVVAAFVDKKDEAAALEAGADVVGAERILEEIRTGKISFEILISTPDMVARLTRYGKILGPKDLMPQAAWGTLTADFAGAIRLYRQTTIPYKADRFNIVHLPIGLVSMSREQLRENFDAAIAAINASRPATAGSKFLNKVHISSTMGPGIFIDMRHVKLTAAAAARGQRGR
ncbi:UNVERIFIED_CONTAM: L1P family of ribosomal protein [Hammondia hammondi]|eukprot:XP_008884241.1 L1P family of ribosomal protein [Hammondia hammondi]